MSFAIISVLASLGLILALNMDRFRELGWARVGRMILIWLAIIISFGVGLRLLGF
jgi:hypothetical protein